MSCGIAGPVVFEVDPATGPYTEQIIIVNHNYDTGDNTESQDINQTIKANKEIIDNDNNTKYTKLLQVIAVIDVDTIKVNDL